MCNVVTFIALTACCQTNHFVWECYIATSRMNQMFRISNLRQGSCKNGQIWTNMKEGSSYVVQNYQTHSKENKNTEKKLGCSGSKCPNFYHLTAPPIIISKIIVTSPTSSTVSLCMVNRSSSSSSSSSSSQAERVIDGNSPELEWACKWPSLK